MVKPLETVSRIAVARDGLAGGGKDGELGVAVQFRKMSAL